jgi:hypothetical protein
MLRRNRHKKSSKGRRLWWVCRAKHADSGCYYSLTYSSSCLEGGYSAGFATESMASELEISRVQAS